MRACPHPPAVTRATERLREFFFGGDDDRWLSLLRVGLGLELIAYCLTLRSEWLHLFGEGELLLIRRLSEAMVASQSRFVPNLSWLLIPAERLGIGSESMLLFTWWWLLLAGIFLVAGLQSRVAAISAWFVHLCVAQSGMLVSYGVDNLITIGLFYLMLAPLPDRFALETRWSPRVVHRPELLGFLRRILQLHLCLIYLSGGLAKVLGSGWWTGESLWHALTRTPFNVLPPPLIARFSWALLPLGLTAAFLELCYPVLIWPKRTRRVWLILTCAMHAGIGLFMAMPLFGAIMIVLNVAAFAPRLAPSRT